ncbi:MULTISPECIES: hypothetical protein [unclassified Pseudomonas]|uniref:hypothetical protein n=1 Tax=unclassified Pseudomonas TaxID=196821 RepID=UPI002AC98B55|nr:MULTISPECIES: hypothetical protein [unclassified Pseudomonas]MEB0042674.1 hypothetical protein [Pseudomonas sp. MH10]MEB0079878.1 hypothetical protein [Pseudomonas sp. MH10out]MEB0093169.1 hypothetical protein [Pseudomonas sp. CCI4.2]MEB0104238.1 hypothetical protein [Pseudomonas sp. CCI3.2]MEB0122882.1 hypothetical protein [Pseudomonas sp. CCI1.2]
MRWLFLLLLVLNIFYYLWHQQEAPLHAKEIIPFSLYKSSQQDIKLLSESDSPGKADEKCLYLGGFTRQEDARSVEQRLTSLDIQSQPVSLDESSSATYWLKILPGSRRLIDDGLMSGLILDFSQLKQKIMSCEGIATAG